MKKIKVLIITGGLQIGGAERVGANIGLYGSQEQFEFHYLIFDGIDNAYGPELESKGCRIFSIPQPRDGYLAYIKTLLRIMKENQYGAIHSHTMFNSGINLLLARLRKIPVRIAHSHTIEPDGGLSFLARVYTALMRKLVLWNATHYFACGVKAGNWLYGENAFRKKGKVIFNGIDTLRNGFKPVIREKVRRELHVENCFVIGHTGSLLPVKNQAFLIELMPEILRRRRDAVLVLVGQGEQLEHLQALAEEKGVGDHVIFYGPSMKVHELLSAFDVFAFPSLWEGTPLSLLEAQANGLPCVVSDNVPKDAFLTDLITVLSLEEPMKWLDAICSSHREVSERYSQYLQQAGYSADTAYAPIYQAYKGEA